MILLSYLSYQSINSVRDLLGRSTPLAESKQLGFESVLSTRTAFLPDIPLPIGPANPLLLPQLPNLRACDALVVAIIPLPDIFCNLHIGFCPNIGIRIRALFLPWELYTAAEVEEFEGFLGTFSWGNVAFFCQ